MKVFYYCLLLLSYHGQYQCNFTSVLALVLIVIAAVALFHPRLSLVSDFPLDHKFEVFNHEERRIWGFYPNIPTALQNKMDI